MPSYLSENSQQTEVSRDSRWPRAWRPYAALLSGFCGMANSWYILSTFCSTVAVEINDVIVADGCVSQGPDHELWDLLPILRRASSTWVDRHDHRADWRLPGLHGSAALIYRGPPSRRTSS